jgi:hypothetical protein
VTPSISFIVLVIVLGTLAFGWGFYRRQQRKRPLEPGGTPGSVPLPGKQVTALRTRLGSALVALSFAGLTLLLSSQPPALAASAQQLHTSGRNSLPLGGVIQSGNYLVVGGVIHTGYYMESADGQYFAILQSDGNFVLNRGSGPSNNLGSYWATNTGGHSGGQFFALMGDDGNFCVLPGTDPVNITGPSLWCNPHSSLPQGNYFVTIQKDGNLCVYHGTSPSNSGSAVWCSGTAAVGAKFSNVSGNNQTQPLAGMALGTPTAVFAPLSVTLTDNIGNPLAGKQINWSVGNRPIAMTVALAPGSGSATSTTDANGVATLNQMQGSSAWVSHAAGAFNIVASSGSASVTFNLTVGGSPSLSTTIVAGNNQSVARTGTQDPGGDANFAPLQVKVLNSNGTPASGVNVGFQVGSTPSGMACDLNPDGAKSTVVTTDANGIATLNRLYGVSVVCYYASGPFTVLASTTGGSPTPVTFNETVSS